jgi:hypothetical protein
VGLGGLGVAVRFDSTRRVEVVLKRVEQIGAWKLSHIRRQERRLEKAQDERGVVRGEQSPRGVVAAHGGHLVVPLLDVHVRGPPSVRLRPVG